MLALPTDFKIVYNVYGDYSILLNLRSALSLLGEKKNPFSKFFFKKDSITSINTQRTGYAKIKICPGIQTFGTG